MFTRHNLRLFPYNVQTRQPLSGAIVYVRKIFPNVLMKHLDSGAIDMVNIWHSNEAYFSLGCFDIKQNFHILGKTKSQSFRTIIFASLKNYSLEGHFLQRTHLVICLMPKGYSSSLSRYSASICDGTKCRGGPWVPLVIHARRCTATASGWSLPDELLQAYIKGHRSLYWSLYLPDLSSFNFFCEVYFTDDVCR